MKKTINIIAAIIIAAVITILVLLLINSYRVNRQVKNLILKSQQMAEKDYQYYASIYEAVVLNGEACQEALAKKEIKTPTPRGAAPKKAVTPKVVQAPSPSPRLEVEPAPRVEAKPISTPVSPPSTLEVVDYPTSPTGDNGIFYDNGNMVYYIALSELEPIKARDRVECHLNSTNGVLGEVEGNYMVFRTPYKYSSPSVIEWAVFLGYNTQYGFDMWYPHEAVKVGNTPQNSSPNDIVVSGYEGWKIVTKL